MDGNVMKTGNQETVQQERSWGVNGSTLKLIAIITMMIDHIGAAILEPMLIQQGMLQALGSAQTAIINQFIADHGIMYWCWYIGRMVIGRMAFPIFCFLLVEGFQRTRDVKKYALRLGLFALLSEIPFDLAFKGKILEFEAQNVFFTLFIGLLTMIAFDWIGKREWHVIWKLPLWICSLVLGMAAADLLITDYWSMGIICIMTIYVFRRSRLFQVLTGSAAFVLTTGMLWTVLGFIPVWLYNGKKGWNLKYVFYLFYPVHLLILYGIGALLGIRYF